MFTFALLYLFFYYQVLYTVFIFMFIYVNIQNIQQYSLSHTIQFILNYSSYTNNFFILILILSGLPPVSFFLIKLVFLLNSFAYITFFLQVLFFFNFLLGMFFYLQCFNITNKNYTNSNFGNNLLEFNTFTILQQLNYNYSQLCFSYWKLYVGIVLFNVLGSSIFFDLYIIFLSFNY